MHELFTFVINLFIFQFIFKLVVYYSSLKRLFGENDLKSEYDGTFQYRHGMGRAWSILDHDLKFEI